MKEKFNLIATAAAGLEAVVGRQIRELGLDCQVENGRVRFEGDVSTIIQTNLWLRAADRIKIVVGSFPAKTFEELFQEFLLWIGRIIYRWELNFLLPRPNVSSQNFTMSLAFRLFLKRQLSRSCRSIMHVRKGCPCRKMELSLG